MDFIAHVFKYSVKKGCLFALALCISACTHTELPETLVSIDFKVARTINPDDRQRPSPLVISVFELKTPDTFQQSDFYSLYEHPVEQLSADLVAKRKLRELVPGIDRTDSFTLSNETHYVGILAEFVQYQQAKARLVVPVKPKEVNHLVIELSETELKWLHDVAKQEQDAKENSEPPLMQM